MEIIEFIMRILGRGDEDLTFSIAAEIGVILIALIVTLIKSLKFVQEGEQGIRLRFGKAVRKKGVPKVINPGFIILIPYAESLKRRHVRQQTIRFEDVKVVVGKNLPFILNATMIFRVSDVYKALFEVDDLESNIRDYASHILYNVISERSMENIFNLDEISEKLLEEIQKETKEWGVEFKFFNINSIHPAPETANYLTIQPIAQARLQALEDMGIKKEDIKKSPIFAAVLVGYQPAPVFNGTEEYEEVEE